MTSCTEGTAPSTPPRTNPQSDMAKAFAAVQPSNLCQRRSHALRPSCWSSSGRSRTLAQANADKNSAVSSDHRPPTSAPKTTSRALLPSPASSGYVRSFRRGAFSRALPFFSAAPRIALPSRCRGDTNVVSMANWAPRGEVARLPRPPNACCPRHYAATGPNRARRRSNALELHLHGGLLLLLTPAPNLCPPTPLLLRMLHGGGQGRQVDGHTGSCEQIGAGANEVCGRGVPEKGRGRIWRCGLKEN